MRRTDVVIVGGGQAGLAMSRCLSNLRIEHVVLERGQVAERWRSERWDSLRLLTPNWMTRLPGFQYDGPDPDGFMTRDELVAFFEGYARSFPAPLETDTSVEAIDTDVEASDHRFLVTTTRGVWHARNIVLATGYSDRPLVPAMASQLDGGLLQVVPSEYRSPAALPDGPVLVVGASATGIQLADEIQASGRQVVLSTGQHLRVPRRYRGRDIMWWLDRAGILDETKESVYDVETSRHAPSFQLVGRPDHATLDLQRLRRSGVLVVGRLTAIDGHRLRFDDDLVKTTAGADAKLASLLSRLDRVADTTGLDGLVDEPEPFEPLWPGFVEAPTDFDVRTADIHSVVWATGYRRTYPWLKMPLLDSRGELRHHGGVTPCAGVYAIGLSFQRTRKSAFIDGVGADAHVLARYIAARLGQHYDSIHDSAIAV
ncbi:MAG TPA: NAD(P)-binding domain-containing protein [Vicinamibacterales bacterium]|jgi:putative flavoprotein involved in K+ transport|nr:NAD(P)-binding domain-containing protein [Vicinamibacterales bacterium]